MVECPHPAIQREECFLAIRDVIDVTDHLTYAADRIWPETSLKLTFMLSAPLHLGLIIRLNRYLSLPSDWKVVSLI